MTLQANESMFSGILGRDYDLLKLLSPLAAEMSRLVGEKLAEYASTTSPLRVLEIGGGTGVTTLAMLSARPDAQIVSLDSAATMQDQAKQHLRPWVEEGRLSFILDDALQALRTLETASFDAVATAYTLHNFEESYRREVITEIYRVLKPGGQFINGDRYALDDPAAHTRLTQQEVSGYFRILGELQRYDLLEQWIVHLFSDESEHHIMRETKALQVLRDAGFAAVELGCRQQVNALVTALKPT